MVAIATPVQAAPSAPLRPATPAPTSPAPTLTELGEAQQSHEIYAFSLGDDATQLARLRAIYSRKLAELDAVLTLFDETTPDLLLRAADGRQVALRLPDEEIGSLLGVLHLALDNGVRRVEAEIVAHLRQMEEDMEVKRAYPAENSSPRLAMRASILALCAPGHAALPTAGAVWLARTDAAEALVEQKQQLYDMPDTRYRREVLWHPHFPAEYVACVSKLPLYELAEFHEALPKWCNQERLLDAHDYAYLRDVLSEALASQPSELAALRLRRALAWVEQAGTPAPTPPRPTPPAGAVMAVAA